MDWTIRIARPDDLAGVDTLLRASYPALLKADYPPSVLVTALPRIMRAQPVLLASGTYYLAVDAQGAILGAGGLSRDRAQAGLGHVRHVATHPRYLRRGIAGAILTRVRSCARGLGMTRLECWSTRTAVPFYKAMGFVLDAPMTVPLAPGIDFPALRLFCDLGRPLPTKTV